MSEVNNPYDCGAGMAERRKRAQQRMGATEGKTKDPGRCPKCGHNPATDHLKMQEEPAQAKGEVERLRAELVKHLDDAMRGQNYRLGFGKMFDWWCNDGNWIATEIGDRLVELGTWERYPEKDAERGWYYRPLEKPTLAASEGAQK